MLKRLLLLGVLVGLVSVAALACSGGDGDDDTPAAPPPPPPPAPAPAPAPPPSAGVFEVVNRDTGGSGKYEFSPSEMTFKVGETVSFRVSAETEFHTFNVDDLGIDQAIDGGQSVEFTHTFDKAGTYKLYCIPHESLGMVGTITVQ